MENLENTQFVAILGGGESGIGAAILAKTKGFQVFVSDFGRIKDRYKLELETHQIEWEEGGHSTDRILAADWVIKSPGIPDKAPIIKMLKSKGVEILDEIEFGSRFCSAKIIAITGSNGKTTTTALTYNLLKTAGFSVGVGGNIGKSFAKQVATEHFDWYVLEVSSFQLDYCFSFQPDIAILLNITPDHLDRYDYKMENYIAAKFRITQAQTRRDTFVFNEDDENIDNWLKINHLEARPYRISTLFFEEEKNQIEILGSVFDLTHTALQGPHNRFNASCAVAAAKFAGATDRSIQQGLETFVSVPHRLEKVAEINGVTYINDSKATNLDSVKYALLAMTRPVVWIAGGQDKGNDYTILEPLVRQKVRAMICLGADNAKLKTFFGKYFGENIPEAKTAEEAVQLACQIAQIGETVLLSPACASFDLFTNFEQRGDLFRQAVLNLKS